MVFFIDDSPLWVSDVKIASSGVITGWVENGHWKVTIDPIDKTIGTVGDPEQRTYSELKQITVPRDILQRLAKIQPLDAIPGGVIYIGMQSNRYPHYDDVIHWARKQLAD